VKFVLSPTKHCHVYFGRMLPRLASSSKTSRLIFQALLQALLFFFFLFGTHTHIITRKTTKGTLAVFDRKPLVLVNSSIAEWTYEVSVKSEVVGVYFLQIHANMQCTHVDCYVILSFY
jgi:hypothetical protein